MTIRITDHAVLRWLERIHGVDVESFRAQLRTEVEAAAVVGSTLGRRFTLKREDGNYIFEDGKLVTVAPPNRIQLPERSTD